jgi:hypothetical protein
MGRGKASGIDDPVDLPKGWRWIQWRVENDGELVEFLEGFDVRMRRAPGDHMLVQARHTGLNLQLSPGDCLVIKPATDSEPEQLGLIHSKNAIHHRESETLHLEH